MKIIGHQGSLPVGCFFLIRRDIKDAAGNPVRVPALTIHRVPRRDAELAARSLANAASFAQGYDVVGLDSECDCLGRAVLEPDADHDSERAAAPALRCVHDIPVAACPICVASRTD